MYFDDPLMDDLGTAYEKRPRFRNDAQGRAQFERALQAYWESGLSLDEFFAEEPYFRSESSIRQIAKRFGLDVNPHRTAHSQAARREALIRQRAEGIPPDVLAHWYGVAVSTLRQWTKEQRLPFKKNTKMGRRQWWWKQIGGVEPEEVPLVCVRKHLPFRIAAAMYHELRDPDEYLMWEISPTGMRVVPGMRVVRWGPDDYLHAVSNFEAADPETTGCIVGYRRQLHYLVLDDLPEPEEGPRLLAELPDRMPIYRGDPVYYITRHNTRCKQPYTAVMADGVGTLTLRRKGSRAVVLPTRVWHADDDGIYAAIRAVENDTAITPPEDLPTLFEE